VAVSAMPGNTGECRRIVASLVRALWRCRMSRRALGRALLVTGGVIDVPGGHCWCRDWFVVAHERRGRFG
jgi:hypothetical protein